VCNVTLSIHGAGPSHLLSMRMQVNKYTTTTTTSISCSGVRRRLRAHGVSERTSNDKRCCINRCLAAGLANEWMAYEMTHLAACSYLHNSLRLNISAATAVAS